MGAGPKCENEKCFRLLGCLRLKLRPFPENPNHFTLRQSP